MNQTEPPTQLQKTEHLEWRQRERERERIRRLSSIISRVDMRRSNHLTQDELYAHSKYRYR